MFAERWHAEDTQVLRRLWADGVSMSLIAGKLEVTRSAVAGKISRLKLTRRPTLVRVDAGRPAKRSPRPNRNPRYFYQPQQHAMAKEPPPEPEICVPVHLSALEAQHCRWPVGETHELLFCGRRKLDGSSYCPMHHRKAHTKGGQG